MNSLCYNDFKAEYCCADQLQEIVLSLTKLLRNKSKTTKAESFYIENISRLVQQTFLVQNSHE